MNYKELCEYQGNNRPRYVLEVSNSYTGETVKQQHKSKIQALKNGVEIALFLSKDKEDNRKTKNAMPQEITINLYMMKKDTGY
jgi:hypothetical protein